jgi:hypothetical protein
LLEGASTKRREKYKVKDERFNARHAPTRLSETLLSVGEKQRGFVAVML